MLWAPGIWPGLGTGSGTACREEMGGRDREGLNLLLHTAPPACPPARLPAGVDAPTSRPGLGSCICWAIASCVSPAQLQFCLLQEALRALQGRAAMSSDESAPQMTRVLSLSRTT